MSIPVAPWKRIIPRDPMIAAKNARFGSLNWMMAAGVNTDPNPRPREKP